MAKEWEYKELPKANGKIAPAKWDKEKKEWVPYSTKDKIEITNFPNVLEKLAELDSIKQTQNEIISALQNTNDTLQSVIEDGKVQSDTRLIGSNVEFKEVEIVNSFEIEVDGREINKVYADAGEIWTLMRVGFEVRSDPNATGDSQVDLFHGEGIADDNWIVEIKRERNSHLRGLIPGRFSQYDSVDPENSYELIEAIRGTTILSDDLPLQVRVWNRSDKPMTSRRRFRLFFKVEKVGVQK